MNKMHNEIFSNYIGVDYEEDSYYSVEGKKGDQDYSSLRREIILQKEQYSIEYICNLIKSNYLDLSPEFQRNEVWQDLRKKSLFIESILLNIPIPIFYAYSNDEEIISIIDGKQRLSTIRDFKNGVFALKNMHYLTEFEGLKYFDLPERVKMNFDRYQCYFYILNHFTPKRYIFDIFMRINTGSVPLTAQEIRNIFTKPIVRKLLCDMSNSVDFKIATRQKINDVRMDAQEMALRYIALYFSYDYITKKLEFSENYFSELLENTITKLNGMNEIELSNILIVFKKACRNAYELFGDFAFSKLKRNSQNKIKVSGLINKTLFSVFTVLLSDEKYDYVDLKKYSRKTIDDFCDINGDVLNDRLKSGTKSNYKGLFVSLSGILEECIKL